MVSMCLFIVLYHNSFVVPFSFTTSRILPSISGAAPQSPASPVLSRLLLHFTGLGGLSGVSPRLPAACSVKLEQVCQERSNHHHQADPPGPGGQPKL